jgi:hypothetical protein
MQELGRETHATAQRCATSSFPSTCSPWLVRPVFHPVRLAQGSFTINSDADSRTTESNDTLRSLSVS